MQLSRRDVMKFGVLASAALVLPIERVARTQALLQNRLPTSKLPKPFTVPFTVPPVASAIGSIGNADVYSMDMLLQNVDILPGLKTPIFGYDGMTPGPTVVVEQGREAIIRHCNMLPAKHPVSLYDIQTSVHLHGSASLPQYDGYASDVTKPNEFKDYRYPNFQDARTLWYHDHGVHHTAENAYMGLAGMYIMRDPKERALGLPQGRYDVPLIVRDAMFASDGQLIFDDNSHSGVYGDVNLVNGKPWPVMKVERRKYRFRILNASISRSFDWRLSTGDPLTVIGTDGGLMPAPQSVRNFRHAPAERYEVVIDFAKYKIGQRVELRNVSPKNNRDFDRTHQVMAFDVASDATDTTNNTVPPVLNTNTEVMGLTPAQSVKTRRLRFHKDGELWVVNGKSWNDVVNSDYKQTVANPSVNDVEIWELENKSGGWFHPVHIHLVDFKVLDRNGAPPMPHERGPKDVVYLGENETVRVIVKFGDSKGPARTGRYMIHCHNLSHEDHDMMVQFEVGSDGPDPIGADRPRPMIEPLPPIA